MSKYIDAEKLKVEVERRKEKWLAASRLIKKGKDKAMYAAGKSSAYTEFFSLITSLQQEQPESICSRCVYRNKTDELCEYPYGGRRCRINENGVYECNGFEEIEQQGQPESELEEAARHVYESWMGGTMDDVRRDMVELGKALNARKED